MLGILGALDWLPADDTDDWLHLALVAALLGGWLVSRNESPRPNGPRPEMDRG